MTNFPKIQDADILGETVLLRLDLDVPLEGSKITDDSRLLATIKTVEYLLGENCKVILCGHLGRPKSESQTEYSLLPIAEWYSKKFDSQAKEASFPDFSGWHIVENLYLLENLRFDEGEEKNDEDFAKKLASLAEVYVNDAFASTHRSHASIAGVPKFLSHYAGFRLQEEIESLSEALEEPKRPLTVVIGGAKIETKLPLVSKMHGFADHVLVAGEIAEHTRELLKVEHAKTERKSELYISELTPDGKDITEDSLEKLIEIVGKSKTVVWNGPLGVVLPGSHENTSAKLAKSVAENSNIYSIVGGGDTIELISRVGLKDKFSFVSTGGGAMLEFLAGEKLSGLEALQN